MKIYEGIKQIAPSTKAFPIYLYVQTIGTVCYIGLDYGDTYDQY